MIEPTLRLLLTRLHSVCNPLFTHTELQESGGDIRLLLSSRILRRVDDLEELTSAAGARMAVRRHDKAFYGVPARDDDYFDPVPLIEQDVTAYEINIPALTKAVCKDNDMPAPANTSCVWPIHLGLKSIPAWGTLDVYLAFPADNSLEMMALCKTLEPVDNSQGVGLVTPMPLRINSELQTVLSANRIVPISLYAHLGTSLAIDWGVAIGSKTPPLEPDSANDPLDRLVCRRFITAHFTISEDAIRRYDRKGQTPKGATWQFIKDSTHKQRKLYNLRMVFNALEHKLKAEYRSRGDVALAQVLDAWEDGEKPAYQVRGKPNGKMHK